LKQILPGIFTWSWLSPKHGYKFNGYAIKSREGLVIIDPAVMNEYDWIELESIGTPRHVVLTNSDHERISGEFRKRYNAKIYIHEKDAPLLKAPPDVTFKNGTMLPGGLETINVNDNKTPGETALFTKRGHGALFIGDAVIGWPRGELALLPREKYKDAKKAKDAIAKLLEYDYESLLLGDGEPIATDAKSAVVRFLVNDDPHLTLPVS